MRVVQIFGFLPVKATTKEMSQMGALIGLTATRPKKEFEYKRFDTVTSFSSWEWGG